MYVYGNGVGSWVRDILKMWGRTQLQSWPKSLTLRMPLPSSPPKPNCLDLKYVHARPPLGPGCNVMVLRHYMA
jgi:hypothetical protein